jgi:hypothetical protein
MPLPVSLTVMRTLIEKRYVPKDGEIIWELVNWTIVRDIEGHPLHSVANIQDITARKQAETARLRLADCRPFDVDHARDALVN